MMIDGGISRSNVTAPASQPMGIYSGSPRLASSGKVILPMVAQVAAEEPDTAAKIVQPITLVCSRRPGNRLTHGASPRNMLSLSLVRNRISPIQMNRGRAVRVQLEAEPHTVTAIASPAGRDENSCMPTQATPASVRPIHTLLPRSRNSVTIRSVVTATSFIVQGLRAFDDVALAAQFEHPFIEQRDQQHHRAKGHRELRDPQGR